MIRSIRLSLFAVLCWLFSYQATASSNSENIHYLVVNELAIPFQINQGRHSTGGIISDIVDEVFRDSGYKVSPIVASTNRIGTLIKEHQIHPWITYDAKVWNSTLPDGEFIEVPLFDVRHSFLSCKPKLRKISSPDILKDRSIAILSSFDYPELNALKESLNLNLVRVDSYHQGFIQTSLQRVDGFIEMDIRLRYNLAAIRDPNDKVDECFRFLDISNIIPPYSIYLSVDKDMNDSLKSFIRSRLLALKDSGQVERFIQRYTSAYLPKALQR